LVFFDFAFDGVFIDDIGESGLYKIN